MNPFRQIKELFIELVRSTHSKFIIRYIKSVEEMTGCDFIVVYTGKGVIRIFDMQDDMNRNTVEGNKAYYTMMGGLQERFHRFNADLSRATDAGSRDWYATFN